MSPKQFIRKKLAEKLYKVSEADVVGEYSKIEFERFLKFFPPYIPDSNDLDFFNFSSKIKDTDKIVKIKKLSLYPEKVSIEFRQISEFNYRFLKVIYEGRYKKQKLKIFFSFDEATGKFLGTEAEFESVRVDNLFWDKTETGYEIILEKKDFKKTFVSKYINYLQFPEKINQAVVKVNKYPSEENVEKVILYDKELNEVASIFQYIQKENDVVIEKKENYSFAEFKKTIFFNKIPSKISMSNIDTVNIFTKIENGSEKFKKAEFYLQNKEIGEYGIKDGHEFIIGFEKSRENFHPLKLKSISIPVNSICNIKEVDFSREKDCFGITIENSVQGENFKFFQLACDFQYSYRFIGLEKNFSKCEVEKINICYEPDLMKSRFRRVLKKLGTRFPYKNGIICEILGKNKRIGIAGIFNFDFKNNNIVQSKKVYINTNNEAKFFENLNIKEKGVD